MKAVIIFIIAIILFIIFASAIDMTDETITETGELIGIALLLWVSFGNNNKHSNNG